MLLVCAHAYTHTVPAFVGTFVAILFIYLSNVSLIHHNPAVKSSDFLVSMVLNF